MRITALVRLSAALACLALCPACYRSAVYGETIDDQGEALPGVSVSVVGTEFQDVSDSWGTFSVRFVPGDVRIRFSKTGYTPAQLELKAKPLQRLRAENVQLWRLPSGKGVFMMNDGRYVSTQTVQPSLFGNVYGTKEWSQVLTTAVQPRLMGYRVPLEGAVLVRLELDEVPAPLAAEPGETVQALTPVQTIPMRTVAVDKPEGLLLELRYEGKLEPGTYAVHWGAFAGDADVEPVAYMFSVEPEQVAVAEPTVEDEGDAKDKNADEASEKADKSKDAKVPKTEEGNTSGQ